jgi:hypothetical protein
MSSFLIKILYMVYILWSLLSSLMRDDIWDAYSFKNHDPISLAFYINLFDQED